MTLHQYYGSIAPCIRVYLTFCSAYCIMFCTMHGSQDRGVMPLCCLLDWKTVYSVVAWQLQLNQQTLIASFWQALYCSLVIICPPILHPTFSLQRGGVLYSNIWLVLTMRPHKHVDVAKSHDDLPVAIWRSSSNVGHVPREFLQVCWYFLQKSGSEIMCIVSGDRRQRETGWFGRLQGDM